MQPATMRETQGGRPTREVLRGMFCETAAEVVEREFGPITDATRIQDLAIDSLGLLEIIGSLERSLRIQLPDESLTGVFTIGDLLDAVEKRLT